MSDWSASVTACTRYALRDCTSLRFLVKAVTEALQSLIASSESLSLFSNSCNSFSFYTSTAVFLCSKARTSNCIRCILVQFRTACGNGHFLKCIMFDAALHLLAGVAHLHAMRRANFFCWHT